MTYHAIASAASSSLGLTGKSIAVGGIETDETEVCEATTKAFVMARNRFPLVCGMSPKQEARRNKRFAKAVETDTLRLLGIGAMMVLMLILSGPFAALLVLISAIGSWLITKELDERFNGLYAAAAMELA